MKKWLGLIAGIICGIIVYFVIDAKMSEQYAISVIGGADGPTSIFIAGKIGASDIFLAAGVICLLVAFVVWLVNRKNK